MKKRSLFLLLLLTLTMGYGNAFEEQIWKRVDAHQFCDAIPNDAHLTLKLPNNFQCSSNSDTLTNQEELSFLWGTKANLENSIHKSSNENLIDTSSPHLKVYFPKNIIQTGDSSFNIESMLTENPSFSVQKWTGANHPVLIIKHLIKNNTVGYSIFIGLNYESKVLLIKFSPKAGSSDENSHFIGKFLKGIDSDWEEPDMTNDQDVPLNCAVIHFSKTQQKDWQVAERSVLKEEKSFSTFIIPSNKSLDTTDKAIIIVDEILPSDQVITQQFIEDYMNVIKKMESVRFPQNKITWEILDRDQHSVIFKSFSHDPRSSAASRFQICRVFFHDQSVHRILFTKIGKEADSNEVIDWFKILKFHTSIHTAKNASIISNGTSFIN